MAGVSIRRPLLRTDFNQNQQTSVSVIIGNAPNSDGSVPYIALFEEGGGRIGQYKGSANGHWNQGAQYVTINHDQNGKKQSVPAYLHMAMNENDGICVSGIFASLNGVSWGWTGDVAVGFGGQWYPSTQPVGSSNNNPRCFLMDKDHTNGIVANGISLHMRDFSTDQDLPDQYNANSDRLCKNTARMTFHDNTTPDTIPKFFSPSLQDGYTHKDDTLGATGGGLKNPDQGIDRKRAGYPDGAPAIKRKRHLRVEPRNRNSTRVSGLKNSRPGHLVISEWSGHSAKEVCEHANSLGPDFVSMAEKTFCDMETGKWWLFCEDEKSGRCFDLDKQVVRGNLKPWTKAWLMDDSSHPTPAKKYASSDVWPHLNKA